MNRSKQSSLKITNEKLQPPPSNNISILEGDLKVTR